MHNMLQKKIHMYTTPFLYKDVIIFFYRTPTFLPSSPIGHHPDNPSLAHVSDDDPFVPVNHPHAFSTTTHPPIHLDLNPIHPHPFTTTHMPKHHLSNAGETNLKLYKVTVNKF